MRIVLDAMGSDSHPAPDVAGAVAAAREWGDEIILVGREDVIRTELTKHDTVNLSLTVVHAPEVIEMHEHTEAVKRKRESSIRVGMRMVREGQADAFVSAGNTTAVLASAIFDLGRIRGIKRPALATIYPVAPNPVLLLDNGATADCKPEYLMQFARMGVAYAEHVWHIANPRLGLVSNGEEADKGNMLVRDTYSLLAESDINFVGNVEPKEVTRGVADVVLTDGFTGNVMVKSTEAVASFMMRFLKRELTGGVRNKLALILLIPGIIAMLPGLALLSPSLRRVARRLDYAEYGGALLMGVDGIVIVGHGRSNAKAVKSAIRQARMAVQGGVLDVLRAGAKEAAGGGAEA
ncbi:MAG: phosphate acyltransferase PlsX [Anaerolineales bacterium]|nr:phosphate acyltransferase PlsX [Anaerolineales bacterium]